MHGLFPSIARAPVLGITLVLVSRKNSNPRMTLKSSITTIEKWVLPPGQLDVRPALSDGTKEMKIGCYRGRFSLWNCYLQSLDPPFDELHPAWDTWFHSLYSHPTFRMQLYVLCQYWFERNSCSRIPVLMTQLSPFQKGGRLPFYMTKKALSRAWLEPALLPFFPHLFLLLNTNQL